MIIFLGLLLVPEIIFSPILNIVFSFFAKANHLIRDNILFSGDISIGYLNIVLFLQLIGSVGGAVLCHKIYKRDRNNLFLVCACLLFLVSFLVVLSLLFVNAFSSIGF